MSNPTISLADDPIVIMVLLFLPLVAAPLGFIFFDNELMIWRIVHYLKNDLRPSIVSAGGDNQLLLRSWGPDVGRGARLHRFSGIVHGWLSVSRWVVFLLPTVLPIGCVLAIASAKSLRIALLMLGMLSAGIEQRRDKGGLFARADVCETQPAQARR